MAEERIPFIAGNWKMHLTLDQVEPFLSQLDQKLPDPSKTETAIAASPLFLSTMIQAVKKQHLPLRVGAENCSDKDMGAYTGEVSPEALAKMGVQYVIVGHSERRKYFHEDNHFINKKIFAVLRNGMRPILCCDETMGRLGAGPHVKWVVSPIITDLQHVTPEQVKKLVVAYEPSWAIGTGHSASPDEAEEGCYLIRQTIADLYTEKIANQIRILYGGSVTPSNVAEIMKQTDIDGILAGGSSLTPKKFLKLVHY